MNLFFCCQYNTLLCVVVGEEVGVDVAGLVVGRAGPGAGVTVGDDVGLLRLTPGLGHLGHLPQAVNIVIGVLHSDTENHSSSYRTFVLD